VTVGESLTEARYQAGLTVDELSERTRIRDTVIRSIERDDYEACGGDLYVRGYVRAIAGAVGIDAQPLIQEFDQERVHSVNGAGTADGSGSANGVASADGPESAAEASPDSPVSGARPYAPLASAISAPSAPDPDATSMDLPAVPAPEDHQDPDATRFDLPVVHDDPSVTRFDLPPVRADVTEDMMAAGYDLQPRATGTAASAAPPSGWEIPVARAEAPAVNPRARRDRRLLVGVAAVALLAVVAVVGVRLASGSTPAKNVANSSAAKVAGLSADSKAAAAQKAAAAAAAKRAAAARAAAKAKATRPHATPPVTLLPVAAAAAFGPGGEGDGDNPSGAYYTISRNPPRPWSTNWYATPQFGRLKDGTGLLLSLGHQDTITSVLVDLSQYQGVDLQLKVGNSTAPQDFSVAATADNTGGGVRLTFRHPASARYLLIWFTKLPPNGDGQYQESVYHVLVNGRR
jgi:hypothetical protein